MARILVIDDDELLRGTVETMLARGGYDVISAANPEDGARQFEQERFDVVICDVFMPTKERGIKTIAALREISAEAPIISMTGSLPRPSGGAHLDPEFLRMTRELGATQVIAKPFKAGELLTLVRQCLEPRATAAKQA